MLTRRSVNFGIFATAVAAGAGFADAAELKTIDLPPPWKEGGKPLAELIWARHSTREFADRPVLLDVLSNLLWTACGVNRPATADRTVPSWRRALESQVFVSAADGVWRYDAKAHNLTLALAEDIRGKTGVQDYVGKAPINLVYVADRARLKDVPAPEQRMWAFADVGFIGQNVYLFCASEGLATVFRGSINREAVAEMLKLSETKFVTCAQTVGYPKA